MSRVALIIPYFGILPNYFPLWLQSAAYNKEIDYLLFTDCSLGDYHIPHNVKCVKMTFCEIKQRIDDILDFNYILHSPYKLCDYKPLYGLIFSDYLREYEFWGHCDPDVIWGDLSNFITDDLLAKYDRLYRRGHLCIYRNKDEINQAALQKEVGNRISYKDVFTHRYIAHYDEGSLIETLIRQQGGRLWNEDDFADISFFHKQFVLVKHDRLCETVAAFRWKEGKLTGLGINGNLDEEKEYSYVHLQKRKMKYQHDSLKDDFLITPDEFIPYTEEWKNLAPAWEQQDISFENQVLRNSYLHKIKNICEGALIFRLKKLLSR